MYKQLRYTNIIIINSIKQKEKEKKRYIGQVGIDINNTVSINNFSS